MAPEPTPPGDPGSELVRQRSDRLPHLAQLSGRSGQEVDVLDPAVVKHVGGRRRSLRLGQPPPNLLRDELSELLHPLRQLVTSEPVTEGGPGSCFLSLRQDRLAKQLGELELTK